MLVFNFYIKVESVLRQGSVLLTWSSLLLDKFFKNADEALFELKDLVKKVCYWIKILRKMAAVISRFGYCYNI